MFVNAMFQGMVAHLDFNDAYIYIYSCEFLSKRLLKISEQLLLANEVLPACLVIGRSGSFYMVPIVGTLC